MANITNVLNFYELNFSQELHLSNYCRETQTRDTHKVFFFRWHCDPTLVMASSFLRFLDHTQRSTTVGRTPLDERSARRRDLYLTTHNTHNRKTSMPRWNSNPRSQQASGRRPTPSIARPLGPADQEYITVKNK